MKVKFFILSFLFIFTLFNLNATDKTKIVFRYDDYLLIPSQFSDSLLGIFKKHNIPLCLGLIPYDRNKKIENRFNESQLDSLMAKIKSNEVEIFLHGFNHDDNVEKPFLKRKFRSEFATQSYEDQYNKLAMGKKCIDSLFHINVETFVPPFNTYDGKTLDALSNLGFSVISASMSGTSSNDRINYLPATMQDFSGLKEALTKYRNKDVTIILYFHPYSFVGGQGEAEHYMEGHSKLMTLNELDTLLNWVKNQDVEFYTFSSLNKSGKYDKRLYRANYYENNFLKKVLYKFNSYWNGVYAPPEIVRVNPVMIIGNFLIHLILFAIVFFFVRNTVTMLKPGIRLSVVIFSLLGIVISFYLYYNSDDESLILKFIILAVGYVAMLCGYYFGLRKTMKLRRSGLTGIAS